MTFYGRLQAFLFDGGIFYRLTRFRGSIHGLRASSGLSCACRLVWMHPAARPGLRPCYLSGGLGLRPGLFSVRDRRRLSFGHGLR